MADEDDDIPILSGNALSALQEFYAERDEHVKKFEALKTDAEAGELSMESFAENWQDSQFWYADETAKILAEELLGDPEKWRGSKIAVVSAPSVFVQVKNILKASEKTREELPVVYLLEFDRRFEVFGEQFVFYDFNSPIQLPSELKGVIDHVICDPPFLSEDCQTKAALTVRWLSKPLNRTLENQQMSSAPNGGRLIVCTGERMEATILKLYKAQGISTTTFEPEHNKSQLSNEFLCYANFECQRWKWGEIESRR